MQHLTDSYIKTSAEVLTDHESLAENNIGFKQMFDRTLIKVNKGKLQSHFQKLAEYDQEYATFLIAHGSINELTMRNAAVQIMTQARNMLVNAIKSYESSIVEFEGQLKFRLNVTLTLAAIFVSIVGVIA